MDFVVGRGWENIVFFFGKGFFFFEFYLIIDLDDRLKSLLNCEISYFM